MEYTVYELAEQIAAAEEIPFSAAMEEAEERIAENEYFRKMKGGEE